VFVTLNSEGYIGLLIFHMSKRKASPLSEEEQHVYEERDIQDMAEKSFRPGDGRISGYISCFLGIMSFLAVLCFQFPSYLTTQDLRNVYDPDTLQLLLKIAMWTALAFGFLTFALGKRKRMGAVGVLFVALAYACGGYTVEKGAVDPKNVSLGLDWMLLDFLGSALLFIFIEKLIPKYKEQAVLRPEWRVDLLYFGINHLLLGILLLIGNNFAPAFFGWAVNASVQSFMQTSPLWVQVIILIFAADLVLYWSHRLFHEVPWLWHFHAVHHSVEHMDWLAGSRNHIVQTIVDRSLAMIPLYLLGPDKNALDLYVTFAALQAVFVHANVGIPTGPLKYIFATPQFHHWHHSSDEPAIDTNYAVHLPLYDMIFGTYHMPYEHWPKDYGTTKRLPRGFFAQLIYPFKNHAEAAVESP
jgi:sterol desaturase/sphingolipid hydroxylase (fatty acid hydroxylase superfamily)